MVDAIQLVKAKSIADPFVGSGTTIMACEALGRRCFACEIEPAYVDVCLRRYVARYHDAAITRHDGATWRLANDAGNGQNRRRSASEIANCDRLAAEPSLAAVPPDKARRQPKPAGRLFRGEQLHITGLSPRVLPPRGCGYAGVDFGPQLFGRAARAECNPKIPNGNGSQMQQVSQFSDISGSFVSWEKRSTAFIVPLSNIIQSGLWFFQILFFADPVRHDGGEVERAAK